MTDANGKLATAEIDRVMTDANGKLATAEFKARALAIVKAEQDRLAQAAANKFSMGQRNTDFVFKVKLTDSDEFTINNPQGASTYSVDCNNDGIGEISDTQGTYTCQTENYPSPGEYIIRIRDTSADKHALSSLTFSHNLKIVDIQQWGNEKWVSFNGFFAYTNIKAFSAFKKPDLSQMIDMSYMFEQAVFFNGYLTEWETDNVKDMHGMFAKATHFTGGLQKWHTSNVEDMREMFYGAIRYTDDLSGWDTSKVTDMRSMFQGAISFDAVPLSVSSDAVSVDELPVICSDYSATKSKRKHKRQVDGYTPGGVVHLTWVGLGLGHLVDGVEHLVAREVDHLPDLGIGKISITCHAIDTDGNLFNVLAPIHSKYEPSSWYYPKSYFIGYGLVPDSDEHPDWSVPLDDAPPKTVTVSMPRSGSINVWNISNVENMEEMFKDAISFHRDLSLWETKSFVRNDSSAYKEAIENGSMFKDAISMNSNLMTKGHL